jgi:hypothetical protein
MPGFFVFAESAGGLTGKAGGKSPSNIIEKLKS